MTAKYFAILTNYGAAQLANAVALGTQMNISSMAVGDGGGTLSVPDPAQTKLVRETRRAAVNQVSIDEKNPNFIISEQVIPENEGGWFIREIGLFDDKGGLIAVGNAPETYKPNLQEGSGRTQIIQLVLMVSSTQAITLKVDPSVVLATREYVTKSIDVAIQESEARAAKTYQPIGDYVTHPYLKLELLKKIDKADITQQLGNDPNKVGSQLLLTEQLGKKASTADVSGKMAKDKNGADIPDKEAFIKNLGLPEKCQPWGTYADGNRFSTRTSAVLMSSPNGNYGVEISNTGVFAVAYLSGDAPVPIFRVTPTGEINDGSIALGKVTGAGSAASKNTGTGPGQIPDMSSFGFANGAYTFPNGLILQVFSVTPSATNTVTPITFPVPFPYGPHGVWPTHNSSSSGQYMTLDALTKTGANMRVFRSDSTSPVTGAGTVTIMALGR